MAHQSFLQRCNFRCYVGGGCLRRLPAPSRGQAMPSTPQAAVAAPAAALVIVLLVLPLGGLADLTGPQLTSPSSDAQFVFDYLGGGNPQSPAYLRCKMTHR